MVIRLHLHDNLESALTSLDEEVHREKALIADKSEECNKLREQVANGNGDKAALLKLETLDKEIEDHRRRLRALESSRRSTRKRLNSLILEQEKSRVDDLQERIKELRERKKHIRENLIPGMQIQLDRLRGECDEIDDQISRISEQLRLEQGTAAK